MLFCQKDKRQNRLKWPAKLNYCNLCFVSWKKNHVFLHTCTFSIITGSWSCLCGIFMLYFLSPMQEILTQGSSYGQNILTLLWCLSQVKYQWNFDCNTCLFSTCVSIQYFLCVYTAGVSIVWCLLALSLFTYCRFLFVFTTKEQEAFPDRMSPRCC